MNVTSTHSWVRRDDVAVASFADGDLAFQATDCRLLALNELAGAVLAELAVPRDEKTLAGLLADRASLADVESALVEMEKLRIVKRRTEAPSLKKESGPMNESTRYLANPDVSCRIEDDDGAILYNPDTKSCQVVNAIGLELWQCLATPRRQEELATHLCAKYDGVTPEDAARDVAGFLQPLAHHGFVGEVEDGTP